MASIAGGQASVIAGGTSSFGQFRLTTFVDSTPKPPKTSIASPVPRTITTPNAGAETSSHNVTTNPNMSSSILLESFSNPLQSSSQAFVSAPQSAAATIAPSAETHNGFGVLELAPALLREGKLGPHRDGRVRNPVPLKLKGRTDDKNGNFAVMHMDMPGSAGVHDPTRSEAAQRTSENTAQAAMAANRDGYIPMKRRRIEVPKNSEPKQDQPVPQSSAFFPQPLSQPPQQSIARRDRVLTPQETKYEQARLLTLLRSINPLTVVDQICKALAFFGGIPGAPPPEDGSFPESADNNGSGGLFVGWLSEIFPELERKSWKPELGKGRDAIRGSRPRGRPKGSKASKVRKDKGIKKGPKHPKPGAGLPPPTLPGLALSHGDGVDIDNAEGEWVDIGEGDGQIEMGTDQIQRPSGAETSKRARPKNGRPRPPTAQTASIGSEIVVVDSTDQNHVQSSGDASQDSARRRPGRPRGSRNRPRDSDVEGTQHDLFMTTDTIRAINGATSTGSQQGVEPPTGSRNEPAVTFTPVSKVVASNAQLSGAGSAKRRQGQNTKGTTSAQQFLTLTAEEQAAALEAFRSTQITQTANKVAASAEKGKRSRPKSGVTVGTEASPAAALSVLPSSTPNSISNVGKNSNQGTPTLQPTPKDSGPILPPPKRQRKSKETNSTPAKQTGQATDNSHSVPVPTATLKSTTVPSDPVVPAVTPNARPPAQGLEAHYERMMSLQQQKEQHQQQHHQQQHHHQHQQHQHQQQQQQQKQQTRHDMNPVTRSSPMQSTTTYYQQPRHIPSPYEQTYPSHQAAHTYQPSLIPQNDTFRNPNQQHTTFSPRQQQSTNHFSHFNDSSFIDVPALDIVANGTANVGTYGQGISRSTSNASFGSGSQMGNGFGSMSENDIRERLLRDIGRR
jgi:hypothetical protein